MPAIARQRWIINLLLLIVVGSLGAWAYWGDHTESSPEPVSSIEPHEITTLKFGPVADGGGEQTLTQITKEGSDWWITSPKRARVNTIRLQQLFVFLTESVQQRYSAIGKELVDFGLDPGQATMTINSAQYLLGDTHPVTGNRYVLHNDELLLVSEAVFGSLIGSWTDFVDLKLIPATETVKTIELPKGYQATVKSKDAWQGASALRVESWATVTDQLPTITVQFESGNQQQFQLIEESDTQLTLGNANLGLRYQLIATPDGDLLPKAVAE